MEEIKEESCSTGAKKCCVKGIILIVVCSIVCFFFGYYFGSRSNRGIIGRGIGPKINRPFHPNTRIPVNQRPDFRKNQNTPTINRTPRPNPQQSTQRMRSEDFSKMPQKRVPPTNQKNALKPKAPAQQPTNKK